MEKEFELMGTGAIESEKDPRTIVHSAEATGEPLITGGIAYSPEEIENQHRVGICTAISRVQLREKQTGKKYSPDFQYLLQKKFYDKAWWEGSSILNANKVAKNIGFLPIELFTWITEDDRSLSYSAYIAKMQTIPDSEIQRLIGLCVDKIAGYASVNVKDSQAIANAVMASPNQSGILCRYGCQYNWWTSPTGVVSWQAQDISPLRYAPETSGHAIILSKFNYSTNKIMQFLANTWSAQWAIQGSSWIDWDNYPMNEAWVDLLYAPKIVQNPLLRKGSKGIAVSTLQDDLNALNGSQLVVDGDFGNLTLAQVLIFQKANNLIADGIVGKNTWGAILLKKQTDSTPSSGADIINKVENIMNPLLQSSNGSGNLSATIKGLLLLMLPVLIGIGSKYGIAITQDNVMQVVSQVTTIVGEIVLVFGLIRKFWIWFRDTFKPTPKA